MKPSATSGTASWASPTFSNRLRQDLQQVNERAAEVAADLRRVLSEG